MSPSPSGRPVSTAAESGRVLAPVVVRPLGDRRWQLARAGAHRNARHAVLGRPAARARPVVRALRRRMRRAGAPGHLIAQSTIMEAWARRRVPRVPRPALAGELFARRSQVVAAAARARPGEVTGLEVSVPASSASMAAGRVRDLRMRGHRRRRPEADVADGGRMPVRQVVGRRIGADGRARLARVARAGRTEKGGGAVREALGRGTLAPAMPPRAEVAGVTAARGMAARAGTAGAMAVHGTAVHGMAVRAPTARGTAVHVKAVKAETAGAMAVRVTAVRGTAVRADVARATTARAETVRPPGRGQGARVALARPVADHMARAAREMAGPRAPGSRVRGHRARGHRARGHRAQKRKATRHRAQGRRAQGRRAQERRAQERKATGRRAQERRAQERRARERRARERRARERRAQGRRATGDRAQERRTEGRGSGPTTAAAREAPAS